MVFEKIKGIVAEQLDIESEEIQLETSFEELGADSLDLVQIIVELEEAFDVRLEEAEKFKNIQDVVTYIEANSK